MCSQEEEEEDKIAGNVNDSKTAANPRVSFVPDSKCAANLRSSLHPWPTRAIATVSALNSKSSGNSPDLRSGTGAATATSKDPPVTPSKKAFHPLSKDEFDALDNDQKFKASIKWFRNAGESFSDFIKLVETLDSGTTEHACEVIDSFGNACKSHLDDERKEHLDKLKKRKVPDKDNAIILINWVVACSAALNRPCDQWACFRMLGGPNHNAQGIMQHVPNKGEV